MAVQQFSWIIDIFIGVSSAFGKICSIHQKIFSCKTLGHSCSPFPFYLELISCSFKPIEQALEL